MTSRKARKHARMNKKGAEKRKNTTTAPVTVERGTRRKGLDKLYHDKYKLLLWIPFLILTLAIIQIGAQYASTGDFMSKGVSLRGGLTITVPVHNASTTIDEVKGVIANAFPETETMVRGISEFGELRGIAVEIATDSEEQSVLKELEERALTTLEPLFPNAEEEYSIEVVGPSLGAAFFTQTLKAVVMAFIFMGAVVFLYFGENTKSKTAALILSLIAGYLVFNAASIIGYAVIALLVLVLAFLYVKFSPPSSAVILAALSDIVITLAIVNVLGINISTAGIAAFLMLIGYSVDTDILLSTRVLKHQGGTIYDRVKASMKTGITMSLTSFAAALVGFLVSQSAAIKQIMLIILIGLLVDIVMTWVQNAGIVRWYAERRGARS